MQNHEFYINPVSNYMVLGLVKRFFGLMAQVSFMGPLGPIEHQNGFYYFYDLMIVAIAEPFWC